MPRARGPRPPGRKPLRQTARVVTLPPPVGGWNARDPLPQMKPEDAVQLDNIIPGSGQATLRKGKTLLRNIGVASAVETLMEYAPPTGANKLFAAIPTAIYDVTSAATAAVTGLSNGRWQHTMFATSAGNYLVICNGIDDVRNYDGASWSLPGITGVASSSLVNVTPHIGRLWFCQNNTLDAWYLPTASISGAATKFALGSYCRLGGYLLAIGSWSRDGGAGPDDMIAFITSKGEVVVYSGTDPASSSTWTQVGVYKIAEPIGRRCILRAGGDLGILTAVGLVPMSQVLDAAQSAQFKTAITDKVSGAFTEAFRLYGSAFGWQVIEYPREKLLVINVPVAERTTQHQYVMSTDTGAWCKFTALNGGCWTLFNNSLYFGSNDGKVYLYGPNYDDAGLTISATIRQAFSDFGTPQNKRFVSVRPLFRGPEGYTPGVEMKVNYDTSVITALASTVATTGSEWDVAPWDTSDWDSLPVPVLAWQSVTGIGITGAPALLLTVDSLFQLHSIDVMFEVGGPL